MTKLNKSDRCRLIIAMLLIMMAFLIRLIWMWLMQADNPNMQNPIWQKVLSILRSFIYVFLFSAWGISVSKRIVQVQTRKNLIAIACLIVLWVTVRAVKYGFLKSGTGLSRLFWYMYYISMLAIPILAVFAAMSLGKPEGYRIPKLLYLLWIPTVLLIFGALTNDLHELMFSFPPEYLTRSDAHYSYGALYFVAVAWILLIALVAFGIILIKCRVPHSRKLIWLPIIPFSLIFVYGILYVFALPVLKLFFGDMTVVLSLLIITFFEFCILSGLIQSNNCYEELFSAATISALITDQDMKVCYSAENIKPVGKSILESAKKEAVMLSGGIRLCAAPIRGGYVYWQEDISALLATIEELAGTKEELKSYGSLLEEENRQKRRKSKLNEQKRLFEAVQKTTEPHLELLTAVSNELQTVRDTRTAKKMLGKIAVIGAYLKRRSNLILISDRLSHIPAEELHLCLKESTANLRLCGVTCAVRFDIEGAICATDAGVLLDFYETVTETAFEALTDMTTFVVREADALRMTIMLRCDTDTDMMQLSEKTEGALVTNEYGIWYCTRILREEEHLSEIVSSK